MRITIQNVRLAFPALFHTESVGDGDPAYGGRFIIDPKDPQVKAIREAMLEAAKVKWKDKGPEVLNKLKEDKRVCFLEGEYTNKNGEPYDGFGGKFSLGTRNGGKAPTKPTAFNAANQPVTESDGLIYGGCYVDASVEFYAQDNDFGRRLNCSLRGVRYRDRGDAFGGGPPASAGDFGEPLETAVGAEDFV